MPYIRVNDAQHSSVIQHNADAYTLAYQGGWNGYYYLSPKNAASIQPLVYTVDEYNLDSSNYNGGGFTYLTQLSVTDNPNFGGSSPYYLEGTHPLLVSTQYSTGYNPNNAAMIENQNLWISYNSGGYSNLYAINQGLLSAGTYQNAIVEQTSLVASPLMLNLVVVNKAPTVLNTYHNSNVELGSDFTTIQFAIKDNVYDDVTIALANGTQSQWFDRNWITQYFNYSLHTSNLQVGLHNVNFLVTDSDGLSTTKNIQFNVVDTIAPTLNLVYSNVQLNEQALSMGNYTLAGFYVSDKSSVIVNTEYSTLPAGSVYNSNNYASGGYYFSSLNGGYEYDDGTFLINYTATDASGNSSTTTQTVIIDNSAPVVYDLVIPTIELGTANAVFNFGIRDSYYDDVAISTNGNTQVFDRTQKNQYFQYVFNTTRLGVGLHNVNFLIDDLDGGSINYVGQLNIKDTIAPVITPIQLDDITLSEQYLWENTQQLAGFNIADKSNVSIDITTTLPEHLITFRSNQVGNSYDIYADLHFGYEFDDGDYELAYTAIDTSGNSSTVSQTVNITNSAPLIDEHSIAAEFTTVGDLLVLEGEFTDSTRDTHTATYSIHKGATMIASNEALSVTSPTLNNGLYTKGSLDSTIDLADLKLRNGDYTITIDLVDDDGGATIVEKDFTVTGNSIPLASSYQTNAIDITRDNLTVSKFNSLVTTAYVFGASGVDLSTVSQVFVSDDPTQLTKKTARGVVRQDYNNDGVTDLKVYLGRSDLATFGTPSSIDQLILSGTDSLGNDFDALATKNVNFTLV